MNEWILHLRVRCVHSLYASRPANCIFAELVYIRTKLIILDGNSESIWNLSRESQMAKRDFQNLSTMLRRSDPFLPLIFYKLNGVYFAVAISITLVLSEISIIIPIQNKKLPITWQGASKHRHCLFSYQIISAQLHACLLRCVNNSNIADEEWWEKQHGMMPEARQKQPQAQTKKKLHMV